MSALVTVTAVGLVALAIALSNLGTAAAGGPTGNTTGAGDEPRIALGGAVSGLDERAAGRDRRPDRRSTATSRLGRRPARRLARSSSPDDRATIDGPFASDGTLVKPAAVDTTVADGADLLRTYGSGPATR